VTLTPEDLERLLRVGSPVPRPDFVPTLERRLFPPRPRMDQVRMRLAIAGVGFAFALAAMVIALGAVGLLPIQLGGGSGAQAEPDCRTVIIERKERVPSFVRDRNGELALRYEMRAVSRPVRRCR
jgi:hypothetical protein